MARLHRARVTAVGSEQDMYRMAYVMLENGDWLPEEDEGPTPTLEELLQTVSHKTFALGGGGRLRFSAGHDRPQSLRHAEPAHLPHGGAQA